MIALNPEIALTARQRDEQSLGEWAMGKLGKESQTKLLDTLREMKTLGLLDHTTLTVVDPRAPVTPLVSPGVMPLVERGGLSFPVADAGTLDVSRLKPGAAPKPGAQRDTQSQITAQDDPAQQPSMEEQQRAQTAYLLRMLLAQDRGHPNLDFQVARDMLDNAGILTLMQDLARLATKEKAAGIGMGIEVSGAEHLPHVGSIHPMPSPAVAKAAEKSGPALPSA